MPLAGIELAIAGGCFAFARTAAFVYSWIVKRRISEAWRRRRNALVLCAVVLTLVYWPARMPFMALVYSGYFTGGFDPTALQSFPSWIRPWAAKKCIDDGDSNLVTATLHRANCNRSFAELIDSKRLELIALNRRNEIDREYAFMVLVSRDPSAACKLGHELLALPDPRQPDKWFYTLGTSLLAKSLTIEEFDLALVRHPSSQDLLVAVFNANRGDLLLHAALKMEAPRGLFEIATKIKTSGSAARISNQGGREIHQKLAELIMSDRKAEVRADLYKVWRPIEYSRQPKYSDYKYDSHWSSLPKSARTIFTKGFCDTESSVQRAAIECFISCMKNPEDLPITRADLATDDGVRAAATKLLPKLEEARPED